MQVQIPEPATEMIVIKWERPNTDGGSPIIGYLVEQRRVGAPTWTKTSTTLIPYPEITLNCIDPSWRVSKCDFNFQLRKIMFFGINLLSFTVSI